MCVYVYIYIYTYGYLYVHTYVCIHLCVYLCGYAGMWLCVHVCTVCMCVCMYFCKQLCMHACMHTACTYMYVSELEARRPSQTNLCQGTEHGACRGENLCNRMPWASFRAKLRSCTWRFMGSYTSEVIRPLIGSYKLWLPRF